LNKIVRDEKIDKTDAKNALESLVKKNMVNSNKDGKYIIYKINTEYNDVILSYLDLYEDKIKNYEEEIKKSIIYLKNRKLFSRDLKFTNKTIKNNAEAIVRFTKATIDIASTVKYIEIFMEMKDGEYSQKIKNIQELALRTAKTNMDKFVSQHEKDQPNLSIYLEFEIPILFTNA
jgi:predicted transcriptional regulator